DVSNLAEIVQYFVRNGVDDKVVYLTSGGAPTALSLGRIATNVYRFASTQFYPEDRLYAAPLRSGGGRIDATGKWLVGAKREYPINRPYLLQTDAGGDALGHLRVPRGVVQPASSALRPRVRVPDQLLEEPTAELIAKAANRPPKRGSPVACERPSPVVAW